MDDSGIQARGYRIHGRVQGVGFRWWAVQLGTRLGMSGRVWNDADGSVVLHLRGGTEGFREVEDRLRVGPMMARVREVESIEPEGPWPPAGVEVVR